MATTDIVRRTSGSATRPPTGLLLSIGDPKPERGPGRGIDWFRPKEGQLGQYADAVARYHEVYGEKPKKLDDLYFLSNEPAAVLDIRYMAWGASGVRIRGNTNFAALGKDDWEEAAFSYVDDVTFYPISADELPQAWRAKWKGQPIMNQSIDGPNHAWIAKHKINVEARLTFLLPSVMGIGTVAQITTKGKHSMRNLMSSVYDQWEFFQGNLVGPPFRLSVRPARASRFDEKLQKKVPTDIFELILDSTLTVTEVLQLVAERQRVLGTPPVRAALLRGSADARAFTDALALPVASDETRQVRDEPAADGPDDALLNRIAQLEGQVGAESVRVTLTGVFGVESALDLDQGAAEQYESILARAVERIVEDAGVGEIVPEDEDGIEWPGEAP
jgi:hypothetical protein